MAFKGYAANIAKNNLSHNYNTLFYAALNHTL
jgi:hypothetical protein